MVKSVTQFDDIQKIIKMCQPFRETEIEIFIAYFWLDIGHCLWQFLGLCVVKMNNDGMGSK